MDENTEEKVETTETPVEETAAPVEEVAAPAEVKEEAPAKAEETPVEVPEKFKKLVAEIEAMSVLELSELVKTFEKKFGVSAAAVAVAGPAAGGSAGGEDAKSSFDVELTDGGASKIAVIKVIKEALGLGLKEAKDFVDGAPVVIKAGAKKEEADELKKKIEEAGGKITLK